MSQELPRKNPPIKFLISVFFGTLIISGAIIFVVLQQIFPATTVIDATVQTGGVRLVAPTRAIRDFSLPSHTGEDVSLSSLTNSYVLLYFGYTHCPDVCLLTIADLTRVREQLGENAQQVKFVFISVDGERDTPEVLANYFDQRSVSNFMIGLSGNEQTLSLIQSDYELFYELHTDEQDNFGNYPVDHTANIFLIDPSGNLTTIFAYGTAPETITEYLLNKIQGT